MALTSAGTMLQSTGPAVPEGSGPKRRPFPSALGDDMVGQGENGAATARAPVSPPCRPRESRREPPVRGVPRRAGRRKGTKRRGLPPAKFSARAAHRPGRRWLPPPASCAKTTPTAAGDGERNGAGRGTRRPKTRGARNTTAESGGGPGPRTARPPTVPLDSAAAAAATTDARPRRPRPPRRGVDAGGRGGPGQFEPVGEQSSIEGRRAEEKRSNHSVWSGRINPAGR